MVKSRSGSSDVMSSTYVPMIGCFVAGFVTNRFLNHQNVVTGELEEGSGNWWNPADTPWIVLAYLCISILGLSVIVHVATWVMAWINRKLGVWFLGRPRGYIE